MLHNREEREILIVTLTAAGIATLLEIAVVVFP
jgi:hypothetical protein